MDIVSGMKILIVTNFNSSEIFTPGREKFLGGEQFAAEADEYDVIVAVWGPDTSPIVIKGADDVKIHGLKFEFHRSEERDGKGQVVRQGYHPTFYESKTAEEAAAEIQNRVESGDRPVRRPVK
jgi:hypothetical protein